MLSPDPTGRGITKSLCHRSVCVRVCVCVCLWSEQVSAQLLDSFCLCVCLCVCVSRSKLYSPFPPWGVTHLPLTPSLTHPGSTYLPVERLTSGSHVTVELSVFSSGPHQYPRWRSAPCLDFITNRAQHGAKRRGMGGGWVSGLGTLEASCVVSLSVDAASSGEGHLVLVLRRNTRNVWGSPVLFDCLPPTHAVHAGYVTLMTSCVTYAVRTRLRPPIMLRAKQRVTHVVWSLSLRWIAQWHNVSCLQRERGVRDAF